MTFKMTLFYKAKELKELNTHLLKYIKYHIEWTCNQEVDIREHPIYDNMNPFRISEQNIALDLQAHLVTMAFYAIVGQRRQIVASMTLQVIEKCILFIILNTNFSLNNCR